jgi:hypothetical protein
MISLWLVWIVIFSFAASFEVAIAATLMAFAPPLLLILGSDTLSAVSFFRVPLQESGPSAFRLFAWVYTLGSQIWLVYALAQGGTF